MEKLLALHQKTWTHKSTQHVWPLYLMVVNSHSNTPTLLYVEKHKSVSPLYLSSPHSST